MEDFSVLIGGKAGDGINSAGLTIAYLLNHFGYRVYMYFDYPSLIKGGHNFAIVRASPEKTGAHRDRVDFVLALNNDTVRFHKGLTHPGTVTVYNADNVRADGTGVQVNEILKAEEAPPIMGNSAVIGAFSKTAAIPWNIVEEVFTRHLPKGTAKNLAVAKRAYDAAGEKLPIPRAGSARYPLMTGNEAIGLGLIGGGIEAYVSYPMTPTSNLLHFLAEQSLTYPLTVVHPENEISVIIMALGFAYAGKKTAVGTSGGGFCLMTEGLSFAGQAEIPVVIVLGQRTGPSTGLPTYTGQTELHFALHAGQGEFPRLIVAPGDAEEAYEWSSVAVAVAWKFQVPALILVDKTLCEGTYCFDRSDLTGFVPGPDFPPGIPGSGYGRYKITPEGVSPVLYPGSGETVVKVNSYTHDESGVTTEEAELTTLMVEKRMRKGNGMAAELDRAVQVAVSGNAESRTALVAWGSNKGVASEVAQSLGLRLVRPLVLSPFPKRQMIGALSGVEKVISVEDNAEGQLSGLLSGYGISIDKRVLKYDGRPFTVEELSQKVREALS
jgi:2-oxoglutarate/2-oxoacid ferredoxin oxidoreductase subunit alpha